MVISSSLMILSLWVLLGPFIKWTFHGGGKLKSSVERGLFMLCLVGVWGSCSVGRGLSPCSLLGVSSISSCSDSGRVLVSGHLSQ